MSHLFHGESLPSQNAADQHPLPVKQQELDCRRWASVVRCVALVERALTQRRWGWWLGVVLGVMAVPLGAIAQNANFGTLTVSRGTVDQANGRTGGGTSLPAIVSDRDNEGNLCLGFGSSTPDFILEVTETLPHVVLQVNSNGNDTTLVVRGPAGIHCGDDTGSSKDASIAGTNWSSGTYRVWVGSMTNGMRVNYTLSVAGR